MGHGSYSYSGREYRATKKGSDKILNIKVDDLDNVADLLTNNAYSNLNAGGYITMKVSDPAKINEVENFLISHGITGADLKLVDDTYTGYSYKGIGETFTNRRINDAMNPYGITARESRDSNEHPNSLGIIVALDETGSMGTVPHYLVKEGLPRLIDRIIKGGIADPQVLFMGIGDHECDSSPLQVGQFESSDELMDKWLTDLYLEGRGGGNSGESYLLAWYFAAYHTAMDCYEKRGKKGYCITIGDEPTLPRIPTKFLEGLMGPGQYENYSDLDLLNKAQKTFNVFHLNIGETSSGSRSSVRDGWRQLLADNFINVQSKTQVAEIIADIILNNESANITPGRPLSQVTRPEETEIIL
jgi:hypothetical protein